MPQHDLIVIGGSAGALQPLTSIIERLPSSLNAVLVAMHVATSADGILPQILRRAGTLPVARLDEPVKPGRIYVAPPDLHLIVAGGAIRTVHGPRENGFRPAIDPLFRTAAREFGPRVIGVVLSGPLSDGTYGLSFVKQHGGIAIVQDPAEADVPTMPKTALAAVDVDYILPAAEIGPTLARLTERPEPNTPAFRGQTMPGSASDDLEPQLRTTNTQVSEMEARFGPASALTCPDCGGALWEVQERGVIRYQCHVGHQFARDSLDAKQCDAVDDALWTAVRVLEEHAALKMRMAKRAADNGLNSVSQGFAQGAREANRQAERIRALLFRAHTETTSRDVPTHRPPQSSPDVKVAHRRAKNPRKKRSG